MSLNPFKRFRRQAAEALPPPAGRPGALPRALLAAPPPPAPRPVAPGVFGLNFLRHDTAIDADGRIVVKASVLGDRLEVASIVFHAARQPYDHGCVVPTTDGDDIRERIFRLLQAAESSDVLTPIRALPADSRERLAARLREYGTAQAARLADAVEA